MPESIRSILEAIFGSLLYDLLLASFVAAMLATLRATKEKWAAPALYGLSGFAAVLLIAFTFVGRGLFSKEQPRTTPENVEANVKAWADSLGYGIQRIQDPQYHFLLVTSIFDGAKIMVGRKKGTENYLVFKTDVLIPSEYEAIISKLSQEQKVRIAQEAALELAKLKIGFQFTPNPSHSFLGDITLSKGVPITSILTEDTFDGHLMDLDNAAIVAHEIINLEIARAKQPSR
jgi:hypothetical protein